MEPVDDFRSTNPATHPALLDELAQDFVEHDFDIRHTLRLIAASESYSRSTNATVTNKDDELFYSKGFRKPLEAEVLADAITDALGVDTKYGNQSIGTRAVALMSPKTPSRTLDVLGRCSREESCEASPTGVGGLAQKLHLLNGELLNARISQSGGQLERLIKEGKTPIEIIEEFYVSALSRLPNDKEKTHWKTQLDQLESLSDQESFLQDFVWGLMTCKEFVTNH